MAKVKFELNIDKIIESTEIPCNTDKVFFGEGTTGKSYLFVNTLTGEKQAILCAKEISDESKYASTHVLYLPPSTTIINEEDKAEHTHDEIMAHVQDCFDKIRSGMVDMQNEINVYIGQEFDALKAEGVSGCNGISEKTLLDALRIVSKQSD